MLIVDKIKTIKCLGFEGWTPWGTAKKELAVQEWHTLSTSKGPQNFQIGWYRISGLFLNQIEYIGILI